MFKNKFYFLIILILFFAVLLFLFSAKNSLEAEQRIENPLDSVLVDNAFHEIERQNELINAFYSLKLEFENVINASEKIVNQIDKCQVENIKIIKIWNQNQGKWEKISDNWFRKINNEELGKGRCHNRKIESRWSGGVHLYYRLESVLGRRGCYNKIFRPEDVIEEARRVDGKCPIDTWSRTLNDKTICCPKIFWQHLGRCPENQEELDNVWAGETCPFNTWELLEKNIRIITESIGKIGEIKGKIEEIRENDSIELYSL